MKWGILRDEMAQMTSRFRWYEMRSCLFLYLHLFATKK